MDDSWTLNELVDQVAQRLAALPAPKNGQVRAVPDDRTIRYYGTIGLIDRPVAMRGRTALYGARHLSQVVAIKRLQHAGRSLSEIQTMWPTLDDPTLARLSGVHVPKVKPPQPREARAAFWKKPPAPSPAAHPATPEPRAPSALPAPAQAPINAPVIHRALVATPHVPLTGYVQATPSTSELRIELAPGITIALALPGDRAVSLFPADVHALRAAAVPLLTELAARGLPARGSGTMETP